MRGRPSFRPAFGRIPTKPTTQKKFPTKSEREKWYPDNWKELSEEVKREAGYRCQAHKLFGGKPCGVHAPPPMSSLLHTHHIVPLPKGSNKKSNLIALCIEHHAAAHNHKKGMGASSAQKTLLKKLGKK